MRCSNLFNTSLSKDEFIPLRFCTMLVFCFDCGVLGCGALLHNIIYYYDDVGIIIKKSHNRNKTAKKKNYYYYIFFFMIIYM